MSLAPKTIAAATPVELHGDERSLAFAICLIQLVTYIVPWSTTLFAERGLKDFVQSLQYSLIADLDNKSHSFLKMS